MRTAASCARTSATSAAARVTKSLIAEFAPSPGLSHALPMPNPPPTVVATLRCAGLVAALAAVPAGAAPAAPRQIAPAAPQPTVTEALTDADLDRLAQAMRAVDPRERLAAAQAVASASPDGLQTYAAWLRRPLTTSKETLRALIHAIWGQYPNPEYPKGPGKDPPMWLVRPEPKWTPPPRVPGKPRPQRPPKHDPEAVDWLRALAELDLATDELTAALPAQEVGPARAEALLRVALLRAIAAAGARGRRDAVQPLFDFAFVQEGIFRDECGRMIRSMGSYAVPTLVRIYHDRTRGNAKMRRYAAYQMDRMDRLRPGKALTAAPDDATRAEILRAYGEARALDAVAAVLGQVDAVSHRVRREARRAWLRYVDGPPPPPSPKRKRKLPGGAEEAEEKEDYLNYREMATLEVSKVLKEQTGRAPDPGLSAKQMTDQLLAIYDARRELQYGQLFQTARERERAGDLAGAVDDFGWILANQPDHPRRAEMAGAFLRLGEQLADEGERRGDQALISRALGLLRQGLAMGSSQRAQARVHYLDGRQAQRQGGDGTPDFALAVAADPGYLEARHALETARLRAGHPGSGWAILIGGAMGLLALLCASLWFARSAFLARPKTPAQ